MKCKQGEVRESTFLVITLLVIVTGFFLIFNVNFNNNMITGAVIGVAEEEVSNISDPLTNDLTNNLGLPLDLHLDHIIEVNDSAPEIINPEEIVNKSEDKITGDLILDLPIDDYSNNETIEIPTENISNELILEIPDTLSNETDEENNDTNSLIDNNPIIEIEIPVEIIEIPEESPESVIDEIIEEPVIETPIIENPVTEIPNETNETIESVVIETNNTQIPLINDTQTLIIVREEINLSPSADLSISAFSGNGTGTVADPYNINNCTQLQEMSNDLGANFSLVNNIDCSDTVNWNSGSGFAPVGSSSPKFTGSLNGNGYSITNLLMSRSGTSYVGLFGYIGSPGNVTSLIINADITGGSYTGGLTGYMDASTTVDGVNITGSITGSSSNVGGITAKTVAGSTIDNSFVVGNVSGGSYTGGLVGTALGTINNSGVNGKITVGTYSGGFIGSGGGTISNSYANAEVVASSASYDWIGGFAGNLYGSVSISNSYSTGNVSGDANLGGFVGQLNSGGTGLISNSYSTSNVYGSSRDLGGFIGLYWAGISINNSYAKGNVTGGGSASFVGGFVGEPVLTSPATTISNSYSTGNLSGVGSSSGGFFGYMTAAFSCDNLFWDTNTSLPTTKSSAGCTATGKTTAEMTNVTTFTDTATTGLTTAWDFVSDPNNDTGSIDIWDLDSVTNEGYPVLSGVGIGATLGSPTVTLNSPANNYINTNQSATISFNCSATDIVGLENLSLYLTDASNQNIALNQSTNINGTSNSSSWLLDLINGTYTWRCDVYDSDENLKTGSSRTLTIGDTYAPTFTYNDPTPANELAQQKINVEINVSIVELNLDEVKWNWNETNYTMYNDSLILMMNFDNVSSLDENDTHVIDHSNHRNNGTGLNGALFTTLGKYDGGFNFDGSDDEISIPTTFGIGTTNFAISTWVNLDSTSEGGAFVKIGGISPNVGFAIGVGGTNYDDTGNDLILLYEGIRWIDTNDLIGTGWHHVAMSVDGNGYPTGFIDGVQTYSDSTGAGAAPQQDITYIGGYTASGGGNRHADVTIDEVRIWNRSLSAAEVY
ncbi:LamG domain-containing protein, partial [Candidatus Peregrinibacteria bacterium]|nr:LamG domain-containing protein [Candidatus Peregrinibacteria bacterium]